MNINGVNINNLSAEEARLGPGTLVLVVGPSGAGKDTLIRLAADTLEDDTCIRFPRRIITRPADTASEDHDSLDETAFAILLEGNGAALHWPAHGLDYALPIIVDQWIGAGDTVVANVSRRVIAQAARKYRRLSVINVTAPVDVLRARLMARGRETGADINERLNGVALDIPPGVTLHEIVNTGTQETAARQFLDLLRSAAGADSGNLRLSMSGS